MTPNILSRFGFCLSLEEQGFPQNPFESEGVGREINRNTLFGDNDAAYIALLRTWVSKNGLIETCTQKQFNDFLVAHMNRGFELLCSRIRGLPDLASMVSRDPKS